MVRRKSRNPAPSFPEPAPFPEQESEPVQESSAAPARLESVVLVWKNPDPETLETVLRLMRRSVP